MTVQCQEQVSPGLTVTMVHKTALQIPSGVSKILQGKVRDATLGYRDKPPRKFETYTPFQKGNLDVEKNFEKLAH